MSMMAPMMSSMIVGEPTETEVEIVEEHIPVKDSDLTEELSELNIEKEKLTNSSDEKEESRESDNSNPEGNEEVDKSNKGNSEEVTPSETDDDLLEQHEDETPEGVINA
jgi:hypothetical protein